jgi:hypothetical protein
MAAHYRTHWSHWLPRRRRWRWRWIVASLRSPRPLRPHWPWLAWCSCGVRWSQCPDRGRIPSAARRPAKHVTQTSDDRR